MIKNCIKKLFNTKVLDTFCFKKLLHFLKQNTRNDDNVSKFANYCRISNGDSSFLGMTIKRSKIKCTKTKSQIPILINWNLGFLCLDLKKNYGFKIKTDGVLFSHVLCDSISFFQLSRLMIIKF